MANDDLSVYCLAKAGYGSVKEIREMDTDEFLDIMEFENISRDIEWYILNKDRK